jgi:hypothetical protein
MVVGSRYIFHEMSPLAMSEWYMGFANEF